MQTTVEVQNCASCKDLYLVEGNGLYWQRYGIIERICAGCFSDITEGNS
jgi:hypothetical protein